MSNYMTKKIDGCLAIIDEGLQTMKTPYLSFSGGKDSTLLLWLVLKVAPDIKVVFMNPNDHLPDIYDFTYQLVDAWQLNFFELPHVKYDGLTYEEYLGLSNEKLERMAIKDPMNNYARSHGHDGNFWGIRADESKGRQWMIKKYGPLFFSKRDQLWRCSPIAHVSLQDLWDIIDAYNIPYCNLYDKNLIFSRNELRSTGWKSKKKLTQGGLVHLKKYYPEYFQKMRDYVNVTTYV